MSLAIEQVFYNNLIQIFGGSPVLFAMIALGFFMIIVMLTRVPMVVATPLFVTGMLMVGYVVPEFRLVIGIVVGIAVGGLVYSLWRGG